MIDTETLAAAGYKEFPDPGRNGYHALWQKKVKDEEGIRYFIDIFEWRFSETIPAYTGRDPSFEPHVQFSYPSANGEKQVFNVTLLAHESLELSEVEAFFDRQWKNNGCLHYEKIAYAPSGSTTP